MFFMQLPTAESTPSALQEPVTQISQRARNQRTVYTLTGWLGFLPFLLFCLLFELLPALMIVESSFVDSDTGGLTWNNFQRIFAQSDKIHAFQNSISLSLISALI